MYSEFEKSQAEKILSCYGQEIEKGKYISKQIVNGKWIYTYRNPNHLDSYNKIIDHEERIRELERDLKEVYSDQENDPEVIENYTNGNHPSVVFYADKMTKINNEIESLNKKIVKLKETPKLIHEDRGYVSASMLQAQIRLQKSEGDHGGTIIGHTSTGKPIYENHNHPSHKNFTSDEHVEAGKVHEEMYKKTKNYSHRDSQFYHLGEALK